MNPRLLFPGLLCTSALAIEPLLPAKDLILDLDAARGVTSEDGDQVAKWTNQAPGAVAKDFVKRDEGRKEPGSGRPVLRKEAKEAGGSPRSCSASRNWFVLMKMLSTGSRPARGTPGSR
ncbi:hypothetical protein [Luteolibacter sp. Populi]|uniref:hypothetical protein n=1 Tax=Luteolibacter sp. Populi TaxID=3230487 RepID=UPI00346750FA